MSKNVTYWSQHHPNVYISGLDGLDPTNRKLVLLKHVAVLILKPRIRKAVLCTYIIKIEFDLTQVRLTCDDHLYPTFFKCFFTNKWWHHQHVRIVCHHFITREVSVTHMPKLMVQFVGRTSRVAYLHSTCSTCNTRVTSRELPVPNGSQHAGYLYFTCFYHVKYLQTTCQFSTLRVNHEPLVQVLHLTRQPCTTRAPGQHATCHISVPNIILD